MADYSAPQGRSERPVSLVAMAIAVVMFAACFGLLQLSGLVDSGAPRLFIADTIER
jgi:hypothetical protein